MRILIYVYTITYTRTKFVKYMTKSLILNILRRKPVAVLILRGGLGNQLYQLSALAYYSKKYNLRPFVFGFDVSLSHGDKHILAYSSLDIEEWFINSRISSRLIVLRGFDVLFVRMILKLSRHYSFFQFLSEAELKSISSLKRKMLFIRGSFQDKLFPLSLPTNFHKTFFSNVEKFEGFITSSKTALHIRLTDFLETNPFDIAYYEKALELIARSNTPILDCYSDDVSHAKELITIPKSILIRWAEENGALDSDEFLFRFSQYDSIIASRSSLCWWASFLAYKRNPNITLIHPWDEVESFTSSIV